MSKLVYDGITEIRRDKLKIILDDDARYLVPPFQRNYSWQEDHIDQFWDDLDDHFQKKTDRAYFFGIIVLIRADKNEEYQIVDGQQRLATSITFLCVVRDLLLEMNMERESATIQNYIKKSGVHSDYTYRLKMNIENQKFFIENILESKNATLKYESINKYKNNEKLAKAYTIFYEKLKKKIEGLEDNIKIKCLVELTEHFLKYFVVVKIIIDTPEYAYKIFDLLNNRGINLTESDLVKNYLLEQIYNKEDDVDKWIETWSNMLKILKKIRVKEDDFLRHFLTAFYFPTKRGEVFERIIKIVENGKTPECLVDDMYKAVEKYQKLKKPNENNWNNEEVRNELSIIKSLRITSVYPVLLKGLDIFEDKPKEFSELVKYMLIFFFRSKTICSTHATALDEFMSKICKEIRDKEIKTAQDIKNRLKKDDKYKTDDKFVFEFTNHTANQQNAMYILKKLNQKLHELNGTQKIIVENPTIEHIMPKKYEGTEWDKVIEKQRGYKTKREYHKNILNRIGNMAILSKKENSQARNKSFEIKMNEYYKKHKMEITKHIVEVYELNSQWGEKSIEKRQEKLAIIAKSIWQL